VGLYRAELWNAWPCLGKRAENELRCSAVPGFGNMFRWFSSGTMWILFSPAPSPSHVAPLSGPLKSVRHRA